MEAFQMITPQHHNSHSPQQYQSNWKQLTQLALQLSHDEVSPYVLILTLLGSVWWGSVAFLWGFFFNHLPNLRFWPPACFTGLQLQSVRLFLSSSFLSPVGMKGLKEASVVKTPLTTQFQVEHLITIWEDKDHLKMLAWLAETAITRRRIENRILWQLLCLHVWRSGRGVALEQRLHMDHLSAIGIVPSMYPILTLTIKQPTTIQQPTKQPKTNQTIDNWHPALYVS